MYSLALQDEIVERMCRGETVTSICELEHMPTLVTLWRWNRDNPEFCKALTQARADRAHVWAEQGIEIADDGSRDIVIVKGRNGEDEERVNHDHIQRSRLRVETRMRLAEKHNPAVYGQKVQQELTGKDGGPVEMSDVTEREIARRMAFALMKGAPEG